MSGSVWQLVGVNITVPVAAEGDTTCGRNELASYVAGTVSRTQIAMRVVGDGLEIESRGVNATGVMRAGVNGSEWSPVWLGKCQTAALHDGDQVCATVPLSGIQFEPRACVATRWCWIGNTPLQVP